jgi:hypothetical protein
MSAFVRLRILFWLCLGALPAACAQAEEAYGFRILRAQLIQNAEGHYGLDADIDYRFSEPAADALRNGVPLSLVLRFKLKRERGWWWKTPVGNERHKFMIRYHPLSRLFQLMRDDGSEPHHYASLNALLEALGTVRGLPISSIAKLKPGRRYRASLSVWLDIEALPLPLRPVAYLTPSWYLESAPYKWTFID